MLSRNEQEIREIQDQIKRIDAALAAMEGSPHAKRIEPAADLCPVCTECAVRSTGVQDHLDEQLPEVRREWAFWQYVA